MDVSKLAREIGHFKKTEDDIRKLIKLSGVMPKDRFDKAHIQYVVQRYVHESGTEKAKEMLKEVIEEYFTEHKELSQVVLKMTGCLEPQDDQKKLEKSQELMEVMAVTFLDMLLHDKLNKL